MSFEDLQPVGLGSPHAGANSGKSMPEISIAIGAVVFRYAQVQHHDLISLAGVFKRAWVGGLDSKIAATAVDAGRSFGGLGPHVNAAPALDSDDL
jgi:hypothetical protein